MRPIGCSRIGEIIMECEAIGIPLEEFAELSVAAMLEISDGLGL